MNKNILWSLALLLAFQAQSTEIYISDISNNGNMLSLHNVKNVTKRAGYDNQPSFSRDNQGVYFTAMFTDKQTGVQQADIMFYDSKLGTSINVTKTPKISEYSPTNIKNIRALSMIIVEPDGTQRLWKTELNANNHKVEQTLINQNIKPVGYHAWGKNNDLLLFVLGDTDANEPMTLQYISSPNQTKGKLIDEDIGRSLHFNQTLELFSYSKQKGEQQILHSFDPKTSETKSLTPLPNNNQDYTWLNDQTVISASGSVIYQWRYDQSQTWQVFADLTKQCSTQISRLAVNYDQTKLAFVCDEE